MLHDRSCLSLAFVLFNGRLYLVQTANPKGNTILLSTSALNTDSFYKLFYWHILYKYCNEMITDGSRHIIIKRVATLPCEIKMLQICPDRIRSCGESRAGRYGE